MNNRNLAIIVVAVVVVIAGIAYWMGIKSGSDAPKTYKNGGSTYQAGSAPVQQTMQEQELLTELNARIKANPKDWDAYSRLGDMYFGMRRFSEAVGYYKQSIAINPNDVDSYNDTALSYMYTNNPVEAMRYIDEGIKKNPSYQRIWLTKGFILSFGLGRHDEAIAAWKKTIAIDPNSPVAKSASDFIGEATKKK